MVSFDALWIICWATKQITLYIEIFDPHYQWWYLICLHGEIILFFLTCCPFKSTNHFFRVLTPPSPPLGMYSKIIEHTRYEIFNDTAFKTYLLGYIKYVLPHKAMVRRCANYSNDRMKVEFTLLLLLLLLLKKWIKNYSTRWLDINMFGTVKLNYVKLN